MALFPREKKSSVNKRARACVFYLNTRKVILIVNKKIYTSILTIALIVGAVIAAVNFNSSRTAFAAASPVAAADALAMLPASDAVAYVDVKRLLTEAIPNILASDPTKLAKFSAEIEKIRAKTGFDVRSFERVAVGIPYSNPANAVAIARGSFSADALIAAGRIYANGKYTEQKYNGKSIYNFTVTEKGKTITTPDKTVITVKPKTTQVYVAALDSNTLAFGMNAPTGVRAAVDANAGGTANRASADLIALASRNPNALVSFGGNVPASLAQQATAFNAEIGKSIAPIRQAYGSVNTTGSNVDTLFAMITGSPDQANALNSTLGALKQFSGLAVSQSPADQRAVVQGVFDTLKITTQGNEVQVTTTFPITGLLSMTRNF